MSYFLAHKNGRTGTIPSYFQLWKNTTLPADFFCLLLFLEVGWKYHSCCWFKWKLFFVKQSLYYFCLQVTVPTISQVTVPNRFIRIGRDGSISYSQAPIPLNLRTHIPHPFFSHLLMCSCSIKVEKWRNWLKIAATHSHNAVQNGLAQISPRFSGEEKKWQNQVILYFHVFILTKSCHFVFSLFSPTFFYFSHFKLTWFLGLPCAHWQLWTQLRRGDYILNADKVIISWIQTRCFYLNSDKVIISEAYFTVLSFLRLGGLWMGWNSSFLVRKGKCWHLNIFLLSYL